MCNVSLNGTQPSDASLRVLYALEAAGLEAWFVGGTFGFLWETFRR